MGDAVRVGSRAAVRSWVLVVSAIMLAVPSLVAQVAPPDRPLPPAPGTAPLRARERHYLIRGGVTPRVPSPRALDEPTITAARGVLAAYPAERWSCTRLRGEAIDAELMALLPPSLRDGCFFEGFETIAASSSDEATQLTRVVGGGFVPTASLERRLARTEFHGLAIADARLPTRVARSGDGLVVGDAAAAIESARPVVAPPEDFLRTVAPGERWIYVDRDDQVLVAFVGRSPVMITLVSTGRAGFPTELGEYRIIRKQSRGSMRDYDPGRGDEPYYIANVPDIQYFNRGQAFHGVFWHDRFGQRASHGCVNLALADAQWLFDFSDELPTREAAVGRVEGAITDPPAPWPQGPKGLGNRVFVYSAISAINRAQAPSSASR